MTQNKMASVNMIASAFGAPISPEVAAIWFGLLSEYDDETVFRAAIALIRKTTEATYGRMPLFGLMQKELDLVTGALHGEENLSLQAEAEWMRLMTLVRTFGAYEVPTLDRTTDSVIRRIGGWSAVCSWPEKDLYWRRKEFLRVWMDTKGHEDALELGCEGVAALNSVRGSAAIPAPKRECLNMYDYSRTMDAGERSFESFRDNVLKTLEHKKDDHEFAERYAVLKARYEAARGEENA